MKKYRKVTLAFDELGADGAPSPAEWVVNIYEAGNKEEAKIRALNYFNIERFGVKPYALTRIKVELMD